MRTGTRCIIALGLLVACAITLSGCARIRPPRHAPSFDRVMETTGYCSCGKCCNWKRNWLFRPVIASGPSKGQRKKVGYTASGVKAKPGTIAADTSRYPFGTIMYVEGYGYGRVEDRGSAIKGEHIDLYFKSHRDALRWGRRNTRVRVWLPHGASRAASR